MPTAARRPEDIRFYLDVLKSDECQCGREKSPRHALCGRCYFRLPKDMQRALWRPVRGGFEEAYDEAVGWLED